MATRILSAAVLAPVALAAGYWGGFPFALFVTLVAVLAFWEWSGMTGLRAPGLRTACAVCLGAGLLALGFGAPVWSAALIGAPALLALCLSRVAPALPWSGLGLLYAAIPSAGAILLRQSGAIGWVAVLFVLLVVWATDVAAYFGGRALGGPKLWARVSPNKTWSGALSGLALGCVAGALVAALAGAGSVAVAFAIAAALSIASQAGDLLESALKRRFGVKDSGRTIPGHGGVLDRVDGLYGAAALAWLMAAAGLGEGLLGLPPHVAGIAASAP